MNHLTNKKVHRKPDLSRATGPNPQIQVQQKYAPKYATQMTAATLYLKTIPIYIISRSKELENPLYHFLKEKLAFLYWIQRHEVHLIFIECKPKSTIYSILKDNDLLSF